MRKVERGFEKYVLKLDHWETPATSYPRSLLGNFRISNHTLGRGRYKYWGIDGKVLFRVTSPIVITQLQERINGKWEGWMVDDPPNYRAMQVYAEGMWGKVLVGGLGLGLVVWELLKNPRVTEITVVELKHEVIELVRPHLPIPPRVPLHVVNQDFYDFVEEDTTVYDHILVDIWVSHNQSQKLDLYLNYVIPTFYILEQKYPTAKLTFHGFQTISHVKPVSEEMVELIGHLESL